MTTAPTSPAGAHDLLQYIVDCDKGGDDILDLFVENDGRYFGESEKDGHRLGYHALIVNLMTGLRPFAA
jgi:hypothetical protein